jgi:hypothetical protein
MFVEVVSPANASYFLVQCEMLSAGTYLVDYGSGPSTPVQVASDNHLILHLDNASAGPHTFVIRRQGDYWGVKSCDVRKIT